MTSRPLLRRIFTSAVVLTTVVGCNAVLDNQRAELGAPGSPDGGFTPTQPGEDAGTGADAGEPSTGNTGDPCGAGQRTCGGTCVSDADPAYGCGSPTCEPCATARGTSACRDGRCVVQACEAGYADCNQEPGDGCEVDLSKATSCGACGAACPAALPVCVPSGGTFACSTGCEPGAPLLCGDQCVNPVTSLEHCGACDNECPEIANAKATCTNGVCGAECKNGRNLCNGACVPPNDPAACGPTCEVCPAPPNAAPTCAANACGFQCAAGFDDCNLLPADGCEVDLRSDPAHCGACGVACAVAEACVMGVCTEP